MNLIALSMFAVVAIEVLKQGAHIFQIMPVTDIPPMKEGWEGWMRWSFIISAILLGASGWRMLQLFSRMRQGKPPFEF